MTALATKLGFTDSERLVLLSCENLGVSHGANVGVYEALRDGLASTASLMVPAPWAREAAKAYRGADVGVHLTLNAEYECYRWGPITMSPSLLDGNGGFPRTVEDLWDHADLDEVRRECRSQIERAILWGFNVTHLNSHLEALVPRPEFFDVYLELGIEFKLPLRLDHAEAEQNYGFAFRRLAADEGILSPDRVCRLGPGNRAESLRNALDTLEPGVTEIIFRPTIDTPEIRAIGDDWVHNVQDHQSLTNDPAIAAALHDSGATVVRYADLKAAQNRT